MLLGPLGACEPAVLEEPVLPPPLTDSGCGENGALHTALFGSIETSVSWSGSDMVCESMLRPFDQGVRLRFAGDIAGERLDFIVALPTLERGAPATALPSKLTTTVEGSGRFFSTANLDSCWTDIDQQVPIPGAENSYAASGTLYCMAALGEVNGNAAVSVPELTFTTIIRWNK